MNTMSATHKSVVDVRTQYRRPSLVIRRAWRATARKIAVCATCAVAISSLIMPSVSFAAEWVSVGDTRYEAGTAAGDETGTWSWDGADDMQLNGYNGGGISAGGKLDITLTGNNTVTESDSYANGIEVKNGTSEGADLTIKGSGNLDATGGFNGIKSEGDVNIEGTGDISATGGIDGIHANGDMTIDSSGNVTAIGGYNNTEDGISYANGIDVEGDLTIKGGGSVTATTNGGDGMCADGDVHISGSTVKSTSQQNRGILARGETTIDSGANVTASGTGEAIYSYGKLTIDASVVKALAESANRWGNTAIHVDEDDIYILNGSLVEALAVGPASYGIFAENYSEGTGGGHITISDSTVKAIAKALDSDAGSLGIYAETDGHRIPAFIKIIRSNVTASGSDGAIVAVALRIFEPREEIDLDGFGKGTIEVSDSTIVLPANGKIVDLDRAMEGPDGIFIVMRGQTISATGEAITDQNIDDIASDVKIEAPKTDSETDATETGATLTPAAAPIKKAVKKTTGAKLAATGDNGIIAIGAIAAAGVTAMCAGAAVSRKRRE